MSYTLDARAPRRVEVVTATFFDIDEFRQKLIGWDIIPVQLGKGSLVVRHDQIRLDDRLLYRVQTNLKVSDRSVHYSGEIAYIVTFSGEKWCGYEVPPGSLIVRGPQRDHFTLLNDASDSLAIHVPDWLASEFHLPIDSSMYMNMPVEKCIFRLSERDAVALRFLTENFMTPFDPTGRDEDAGQWLHATYDLAVCLVGRVIGRSGSIGSPSATPAIPRYDLVCSAQAYIDECENSRISIEDMAAGIGVSSRSINTAFRAYYGVSPGQYLIAKRLQAVRQGLLSRQGVDGAANVTQLALSQDFYHLSRFAQHYRRMFGELPSETLHRTRAGHVPRVD
jgi:AraC family ethanolamine operon transcriptional activator